MSNILILILITSIWCLGVTIVSQPGMGLGFLREWAEGKKKIIFMPLILCPWCLPSIHSVFGYLFAFNIGVKITWATVIAYPLVVAGASLLTGIVWSLYELIDVKTNYYKNIEQMSYFDLKDRKKKYSQNHNNFKN